MLTKQGLQFGNFQDFTPEQFEGINTRLARGKILEAHLEYNSNISTSKCLLIHSQG